MKAMEAPKKIYLHHNHKGNIGAGWLIFPLTNNDIEYTRTNAFIKKAAEYLYNYNKKQVLKHGARATLGCGEYTINVDEFEKYMKGD